jgi:hypothetical protein
MSLKEIKNIICENGLFDVNIIDGNNNPVNTINPEHIAEKYANIY